MSRAIRTAATTSTTTAKLAAEPPREAADAPSLQAEVKRRIAAKSEPASSIKEALTRWLDEPL